MLIVRIVLFLLSIAVVPGSMAQECSGHSGKEGECVPTLQCLRSKGEHIGVCKLTSTRSTGSCCILDTSIITTARTSLKTTTENVRGVSTKRPADEESSSSWWTEWKDENGRISVDDSCQIVRRSERLLSRRRRVVGGTVVEDSEHPWAVQVMYSKGGEDKVMCGGTLIRNGWVLTAAHCLEAVNARSLQFGVYNPVTGVRKSYKALIGIKHHKYNTTTIEYDAGLVKLIIPGDEVKQLTPACVSPSQDIDNLPVTVSGWGRQEYDDRNSGSEQLKTLHITVYPNKECIFNLLNFNLFKGDLMACAGQGREVVGQDTCKGDSGGGFMAGGKAVVGIVSWGLGCGKFDRPVVMQRVAPVYTWIQSIVDSL